MQVFSCEDGRIVVNNKMETNINGIYAIGDVIGGPFWRIRPVQRG
ncbi:MAG: hypothetical protein KIIPBIDF_01764 [Candidatus Methanoperedenaceae archaeon GB50]|nr:MAG: hypothetical protein KIIPBIDF_01764 [Candidatus Methanoperedenaceae archaeon GB50]